MNEWKIKETSLIEKKNQINKRRVREQKNDSK